MHYRKLLAAVAFLIGAALSSPLISQTVKKPSNWRVISCNTDGTYTCASDYCLGSDCCNL